jgi:uncharacterized protein YdeI (YjbR/CyaY-like superfamily)
MRVPAKTIKTLEVQTRHEWRSWLQEHHGSEAEIWLVFYKRHTGSECVIYNDAVEEALCFGWVDSLVKRLDDARYARKFTPRTAGSKWSTINRRRYEDLRSRGLLAIPGLERPPTNRSGDAPRPSESAIPPYIEYALKANTLAWNLFERLAPSYRRSCIGWIDSAKREDTKQKRLREVISLLAAGKKLGLK